MGLHADHAARGGDRDAWRAHGVEDAADHRRWCRLAVVLYGALSAAAGGSASPEVPPSLATCEQLPISGAVPGLAEGGLSDPDPLSEWEQDLLGLVFRLGVEDVDRAVRLAREAGHTGAAGDAVFGALENGDEERREKVAALLEAGEAGHAKRLALCGEQSVQLECPDGLAGGCGHSENYVPITCDSRLCPDCQDRRIGKLIEKYTPAVRSWSQPTFGTFTIENVADPAQGVEAVTGAFGRLRRRSVPASGEVVRETEDGEQKRKRWTWWRDGGQPADSRWKVHLQEQGEDDLARRLQEQYVHAEWTDATGHHRGKNIPVDELIRGGFYAVDVKQVGPEEYNVHLHALMDMAYIPQAALSAAWESITGDPVVDVRRVYGRAGAGVEEAVMETVAYACKPPEFESLDDEVEFVGEMKGKRFVQPFGSLHGNTPELEGSLLCSNCEQQPAWWTYRGLVREHIDNMGSVHDGESTGSDPPAE